MKPFCCVIGVVGARGVVGVAWCGVVWRGVAVQDNEVCIVFNFVRQ